MTHALVFSNHGLRHSGGIERYLLTLVDALHARGERPTVVAHRFDRDLPEYGWVDPILIRTWGLGGALRDLWFDRGLRRLGKEGSRQAGSDATASSYPRLARRVRAETA